MKYDYENLSDSQFEILVITLCQEILGIGTQGFAKGRDGGRDAKFVGTANVFPSDAAPWRGTTIIQAKHTNGYNQSFSDRCFFGNESSIISTELPRIKNLRTTGELDHYMLFSNRKLTGHADQEIKTHIAKHCKLPFSSIYLCGIEQLECWLKKFPNVANLASIDPIDSPLIISPDGLADVIEALQKHSRIVSKTFDNQPISRTKYKQKNKLNNMSESYAATQLKKYLRETQQIRDFLAAPENEIYQKMYRNITNEFNFKIIAKRKDYQTFDEIMEYLTKLLFDRDCILRNNKKLTRAILFYMYWNCDIGETEDDQTN